MPRPDPLRRAAALGLTALLALTGASAPAAAQESPTSVDELEKQAREKREKAETLKRRAAELAEEMRALKTESINIARQTQALEAQLTEIESTYDALKARQADKRAALRASHGQLSDTLGALQRIAAQPPEALALSAEDPLDVVRGAMMLRVAIPEIERRAAELRTELQDLRDLRQQIARERESMAATREELAGKRQRLAKLMTRKENLRETARGRSRTAARRADELAAEAKDLRELVARLRQDTIPRPEPAAPQPPEKPRAIAEARSLPETPPTPDEAPGSRDGSRAQSGADGKSSGAVADSAANRRTARLSQPKDIRPFPDDRASLRMPAQGEIVTRYGERVREAGAPSSAKGIVIATRADAQVVAPYDGQIAYAGPFKGYGRILIIEHGGRYHTLLAGLQRIDAIVGQWVLAGEPVGVMGSAPTQNPELYVELRRTGRPINPLPWLAQIGDKVRG